jgi:regulator of nucleoside diphosphate kinase
VVSDTDYTRLNGLAMAVSARSPDIADELLSELDRAEIVDAVPAGVVRMGSAVEYRAGDEPTRRVTLVFPADADIASGKVSILTPIGTALIGLAEGQSIAWTARDGREHELTVLRVSPPGMV